MPDVPELPVDDDPPAELDPMGTSQGEMESEEVTDADG